MTRIALSLITAALIPLFVAVTPAQTQIRLLPVRSIGDTVTCHIGGSSFQYHPDQSLISAQPWTGKIAETQAMFDRVYNYSNLRTNIYTVPVTDRNVNVEICPGEKNYIVYNADWVRALYDETKNLWVIYGVMAHEMGHYALNHDRTAAGSDPEIERQADEYAGGILRKMGASLEEAQAAFRSNKINVEGHTHPPLNKRLDAVKAGWGQVDNSVLPSRGDNDLPTSLTNTLWVEENVFSEGKPVYREFLPKGQIRTRTSSDINGYIASNIKWYFVGNSIHVEHFDYDTRKVWTERRGAINGDKIEGSYKDTRTGTITTWRLTKVDYIPH